MRLSYQWAKKWYKNWQKRGSSDYSCRGLCYSNVSFWFNFYCFVVWVIFFFTSRNKLHWSNRLLGGYLQCNFILMHCMTDSLVFLLIHLLSTKVEPVWNRSHTTLLKSTVTEAFRTESKNFPFRLHVFKHIKNFISFLYSSDYALWNNLV